VRGIEKKYVVATIDFFVRKCVEYLKIEFYKRILRGHFLKGFNTNATLSVVEGLKSWQITKAIFVGSRATL
jgi:hypothetical protein